MTNIEKMEAALDSLLSRSNDDAFVIFEESQTKKYVQFAGSDHEQLLLNLPLKILKGTELEKAKTLFKEYSVTVPLLDIKKIFVAGFQNEFNLRLGKDTKKAALIALQIFKEVYGFCENFNLGIEEN